MTGVGYTRKEALRVTQVDLWLGRTRILDAVSLTLPQGAGLAILGPNGAGKSSLLKVIAGLLTPSRGRVMWWGEAPSHPGPHLRRRMGVVLQEPLVYPELTVVEHLELSASLFGIQTAASSIQEAIAWTGLHVYADRRVGQLSRGWQQRLALARAFLHQPALLLLDEPGTALDETARASLLGHLQSARARGAAVVLVTHDRRQAAAVCDRWVYLEQGRVREAGQF